MPSDIRDNALGFEAVKTSLTQTKAGIILRLAIHPNDVPTALIQDWVGTRYMVGMARLGEDSAPEASEYVERANRAIMSAGMLCGNETFHRFLIDTNRIDAEPGHGAVDIAVSFVRAYCGVASRREFRNNKTALEGFEKLRDEFEYWRITHL